MNNKQIITSLYTILFKEVERILRIWPQTIIPPVVTITLYFIIFGKVMGSNIGAMQGVNYIIYIIPGLVMNAVVVNSFTNTVSSFFHVRFHRSVEEMMVSPMPNWVIIAGYTGGGMIRGLLISFVVIAISSFFAELSIVSPWFTLAVILLSSMLFSMLGIINAIFANSFDDISWISTFVLTPLTYLGGVFYPIELLSEFWQKASLFNPILYIVSAFRFGMLGISSVDPYFALMSLGVLNIVAYIVVSKVLYLGTSIK